MVNIGCSGWIVPSADGERCEGTENIYIYILARKSLHEKRLLRIAVGLEIIQASDSSDALLHSARRWSEVAQADHTLENYGGST